MYCDTSVIFLYSAEGENHPVNKTLRVEWTVIAETPKKIFFGEKKDKNEGAISHGC